MKIQMLVFEPPNGKGNPFAMMNCLDEDGRVNHAVVNTLLDVVGELSERERKRMRSLIQQVRDKKYSIEDFKKPIWVGNACSVWFGEPVAGPEHVLIANDYVPQFSQDGGEPQTFTLSQFEFLIDAWQAFNQGISKQGLSEMIGRIYEIDL